MPLGNEKEEKEVRRRRHSWNGSSTRGEVMSHASPSSFDVGSSATLAGAAAPVEGKRCISRHLSSLFQAIIPSANTSMSSLSAEMDFDHAQFPSIFATASFIMLEQDKRLKLFSINVATIAEEQIEYWCATVRGADFSSLSREDKRALCVQAMLLRRIVNKESAPSVLLLQGLRKTDLFSLDILKSVLKEEGWRIAPYEDSNTGNGSFNLVLYDARVLRVGNGAYDYEVKEDASVWMRVGFEHQDTGECFLVGNVHVKGDLSPFELAEQIHDFGKAPMPAIVAGDFGVPVLSPEQRTVSTCIPTTGVMSRAGSSGDGSWVQRDTLCVSVLTGDVFPWPEVRIVAGEDDEFVPVFSMHGYPEVSPVEELDGNPFVYRVRAISGNEEGLLYGVSEENEGLLQCLEEKGFSVCDEWWAYACIPTVFIPSSREREIQEIVRPQTGFGMRA